MKRPWIGAAILAITLLNFFQFPGHTWLQSDTQIYMPILEHIWDPSVLQQDLIVQHPHVAFTLYDETVIALRKVTGASFQHVLQAEQFVFRALGIWGVYLMATALGLTESLALLVTAVFSLGATITGPAVLVFEYEPVPRGFAIALVFLAIGLVAHERYLGAGIAASASFLMHAPTVAPFWAIYLMLAISPAAPVIRRRRLGALWALSIAVLLLLVLSRYGTTRGGRQTFFARLDPRQEELQRLRASYNWISLWWQDRLTHYLILYAATAAACWRLWKDAPHNLRFFVIGLPLLGILSMPASYLLLEKLHWVLVPQTQPLRMLLFVTAFAMILGAAAACKAIVAGRHVEAMAWLVLVYLVPANRLVEWPAWNRVGVVMVLAVLATAAIWLAQRKSRWSLPAVAVAILAPFFLIPTWGGMENYPAWENSALDELSEWARTTTPKDAVFLFPDAGQELFPGVFRVEAERAVYVDWKMGGQVNFFKDLGEEWWSRWQKTMAHPFKPEDLASDSVADYAVVLRKDRLAGKPPVFENTRFVVYKL